MKSASILISNYNCFEMIELCIESVRKFTDYPDYKIIVYDDASAYVQDGKVLPNEHDLNYLRQCRDKGWIEFIEGEKQVHHGGALNALVNDACDTDYAAILDGDIQIKGHGWLTSLIKHCQQDRLNMGVCKFKDSGYWPSGYRPGSYLYCMGLLDMVHYRDGMQVDWNVRYRDRRQEPFLTEFAPYYPPEENRMFTEVYMKHHSYTYAEFDRDLVILDPGCTIYMKVKHDNPKGYKIVSEPPYFNQKYRHWIHCSTWLNPNQVPGGPAAERRETMLSGIRKELAELRGK